MAVKITKLADVDILADPTGSNCIAEVSGQIVRVATQKIIDMVSTQVQDPNKSQIAVTINNLTSNMANVTKQIETIIQRLDSGDINTSEITEDIEQVQTDLSSVQSTVNNLNTNVSNNTSNITTLQNNVQTLQSTTATLSSQITSLTSRVTTLESKVSNLEGYLTMLDIIANGQ